MHHKLFGIHARTLAWHRIWGDAVVASCLLLLVFVQPASAAMRLQNRSLYMNSTEPGATTSYKISFRYMSAQSIGSVDLLFCTDPIPYRPCVAPEGLDVSNATLTDQSGETGYTIGSQTANHIVLTRTPQTIDDNSSTYTFNDIVNPTDIDKAFAIRLRTHASTDATGPLIDFGSIRGQVIQGIEIVTQVPPMLIFCVAQQVADNCASTNDTYYSDMGLLDPETTLTTQSQMAVGTNASAGFAITAIGAPMSAGTSVIESPSVPVESRPGSNQFGINLVANSTPDIGNNPQGTWANAVVSPEYSQPNHYKFVPGDVVAYSPSVSLMKKFTVSYVLNSDPDLRAGVYSTTITYVASGRF